MADPTPPFFSVSIDAGKNQARIRFTGYLTGAAMLAAATEVDARLAQLTPSFAILADFSQVEGMDLDVVPHLTRIMDHCREHGVGLIVRLLPPSERDIGINLLSLVHYRGKVQTLTVDTLAEAERALG
jgi:hypothetical protein